MTIIKKINNRFLAVFITLLFSCFVYSFDFTEYSYNKTPKLFNGDITRYVKLGDRSTQDYYDPNSKSLTLASWNIRDLGRTKTAEEITKIAQTLRDFDIVAIQEVVAKDPAGAQAVAKIADELNRMGAKWDYRISNPTKSPSVYISERYAFLWKTSKVSIVHRAYLDEELEEVCNREPYIAAFKRKSDTEPFFVINFHSRKYNDRPDEEIRHFLDYPRRLNSNRIIIAGDFNLDENHHVWQPFYRNGFKSALRSTPTTLKMKCKDGIYLNHSIDNIYYSSGIKVFQSASIDFVRSCEELEVARGISDHLPVYMEFNFIKNVNQ